MCHLSPHPLRTKPLCFPPAVSHLVVLIVSCRFPIVFPMLIVTFPFLLLHLPSLPVSCPATTRSIALTFLSCSSPWFPIYPDPFPVASPAFPNSDRAPLEHIQEPYLHPDLQATLWLQSFIRLFSILSGPLCHLVRSLQTERYSAEDTLYQNLMPWWKPYPSTRAYTRTGL